MQCAKTAMLLSYLFGNDAHWQWRQHEQWPKVDVTVSACHFSRKYDSSVAFCIVCIRPIYICLEAFLVSNGTKRRNRCVVNYDSALLTRMHMNFLKISSLFWEFADFHKHEQGGSHSGAPNLKLHYLEYRNVQKTWIIHTWIIASECYNLTSWWELVLLHKVGGHISLW